MIWSIWYCMFSDSVILHSPIFRRIQQPLWSYTFSKPHLFYRLWISRSLCVMYIYIKWTFLHKLGIFIVLVYGMICCYGSQWNSFHCDNNHLITSGTLFCSVNIFHVLRCSDNSLWGQWYVRQNVCSIFGLPICLSLHHNWRSEVVALVFPAVITSCN